jgi:hypothetical protein
MATEQIGGRTPDGIVVGAAATDKVGFFGATPVVQQTTFSAVATTGATQSSPFGFADSTQANALVSNVNSIRTALRNVGIVA